MRTISITNRILPSLLALCFCVCASGQQITGLWKGRISKQKVELKIVLDGDSLTGTSYYYASAGNYRRYSIKGHFDGNTNQVVWWDDQLIEEKSGGISLFSPGSAPMLSRADFNCPGGGVMMLDGSAGKKEDEEKTGGPVHLEKTTASPVFPDEWDFVIDNYTIGANHPDIIDSVKLIAMTPNRTEKARPKEKPSEPIARNTIPGMVTIPPMRESSKPVVRNEPPKPEPRRTIPLPKPQTVEEKLVTRQKVFTTEIPVSGDSVELRFYDNAEVDGDSISLFLDGRLLFTHVRLTDRAHTIKLSVADLSETSELVMVAENLGSIPPNTSYMVALAGGQRYEAKLASTENSSAMIRLKKAASIEPRAASGEPQRQ
jgi:hypothetical protein